MSRLKMALLSFIPLTAFIITVRMIPNGNKNIYMLVYIVFILLFMVLTFLYLLYKNNNVKGKKEVELKYNIKNFIFRSDANHYLNDESSAGWIYLTNNEIIYVSYSLDENYKFIIPINDIKDIEAEETPNRFNYGLFISDNKNIHKFLVSKREHLIKQINKIKDQ